MYKSVEQAMKGLAVWKERRRETVKPLAKNIAIKPTFEADYLREAALHRFIELIESSYVLYRSNYFIGAVVTARGAYETLALIWYINSKLTHLAETKDLKHFSERMRSLVLGWSDDDEFPNKTNILTCIRAVDKELDGRFGRHYAMLSEYAHPNYCGTFGAYASADKETLEVQLGGNSRSMSTLKVHIENTITLSVAMLDNVQESYEKVINDALDVCLDLHEKGLLKQKLI